MSFGDSRLVTKGTTFTADVCVVGAGAAGITLATAFAERGVGTCVIESGGLELEEETQQLYRGTVTGGLPSDYLTTSRLRQFGGTTNHWGGHSLPISAHVFGRRLGVPAGEWPFSREELDAYYERAAIFLGARRRYRPAPPPQGDVPLMNVPSYAIQNLRLGQTYRAALHQAASVRVLLHGNAVGLETEPNGRRLRAVRVATLEGNTFSVQARVFVLATGAIENARLLLQPTDAYPRGIGNEHDLVGRYFMEHAFLGALAVHASKQWPRFSALSPSLQAHYALLDAGVHMRTLGEEADELSRALLPAARALDDAPKDSALVRAVIYGETLPDLSNRVTLTTERDALGLHRCDLHFGLSSVDRRSLHETQRLVARIVGERGWGRLRPAAIPDLTGFANHHMGTTRMNQNPRLGVVDPYCRVHGLSNLFIAGSSVFPSTGLVNPTFTIVALAYRLADHLVQGVRDGTFAKA